jgi:methionyl-tRNA synthetase
LEARYEARMLAPRPREALGELLAMGRSANRFFDASAPWKTRKEEPEQTRLTLYTCSILLGSLAYHAAPYVPEAIRRLEKFFDGPIARVSDLDDLPKGYRATGAKPLFRRIEDDEVAAAEGQLSRAIRGEAG